MRNRNTSRNRILLLAGLLLGTLSILLMTQAVQAKPLPQITAQGTSTPEGTISLPTPTVPPKECIVCHPDKRDALMTSPHANAYSNPNFQEGWESMDRPGECLLCHTTNYQTSTGEYTHEGVSCEACHGAVNPEHPATDYPIRSDKEYCGTCHPSTLGEAQLSGHTGTDEVGCTNCHDPHSQQVLFTNPDDMCKECHKEDLAAMDALMNELHLRENVTCVSCHTLDVPHTFLYEFRQNDTTAFMTGFDCAAEVSSKMAMRAESADAQTIFPKEMNWPVVHRVSRAKSTSKCIDCHEMDANTRVEFKALGYSDHDLDKLTWQGEGYPQVTDKDLNLLVAKSKSGWSWLFWLLGAVLIFSLFEIFVTRKLKKPKDVAEEQ